MNKKAEIGGVGILLMAFVGILVGLLLYEAVNPYIGTLTGANEVTVRNLSITGPTTGGAVYILQGQEITDTLAVVITNTTDGVLVPASNYTLTEAVTTNGVKGIILTSLGVKVSAMPINVSYSYQPAGYIDNGGARSMAFLIPIFAALAIAVIALTPTLRSGILEAVGR